MLIFSSRPREQHVENASKAIYPSVFLIVVCAVLSGLFSIMLAEAGGAMAFIVVTVLFIAFILVLLTLNSENPLSFIGYIILITMPIAGHLVPPGRMGLHVFDLLSIIAACAFALEIMRHGWKKSVVYNHASLFIPLIFMLIPVLGAIDQMHSFVTWLGISLAYSALISVIAYGNSREDGLNRMVLPFAVTTIVISCSIIFDKITGVNLSGQPLNLNALAEQGVYRAAGLFQDAQKAAQYLACAITFLTVLLTRNIFAKMSLRITLGITILLAIGALMLTNSRAGLLSAVAAVSVSQIWGRNSAFRFVIISLIILVIVFVALHSFNLPLPDALAYRLNKLDSGFATRLLIWRDSWHIFLERPITGIGPGNYQEFLMQEHREWRGIFILGGYVPDQPESGYLKILYEGGIIGVFSIGLFIYMILSMAIRGLRSPEPYRSYVVAALLALVVFGATFTTLFTVSDGRNLLMLVIILSAVMTAKKSVTPQYSNELKPKSS